MSSKKPFIKLRLSSVQMVTGNPVTEITHYGTFDNGVEGIGYYSIMPKIGRTY